jgi:hypothetical protein
MMPGCGISAEGLMELGWLSLIVVCFLLAEGLVRLCDRLK